MLYIGINTFKTKTFTNLLGYVIHLFDKIDNLVDRMNCFDRQTDLTVKSTPAKPEL